MKINFGWIPDTPDHRDAKCSIGFGLISPLPSHVDLRKQMPAVYDQGHIGSCVAQSVGAAIEHRELMQRKEDPSTPSRLFLYYQGRAAINTINYDSGCMIRDVIKSTSKDGYCEEHYHPYNAATYRKTPSLQSYADARKCKISAYERVDQTVEAIKAVLAAGQTVSYGFSVYASTFAVTRLNPVLKRPLGNEMRHGGHAVLVVGYDDEMKAFIVRNSWGSRWGVDGYFYHTYDYVCDRNLASDFWTIKLVPQLD